MIHSLDSFKEIWSREVGATQKILDALTDASLEQKVTAEDRTLGRLAWHVVTTIPEMIHRTGLGFQTISEEAPVPRVAAEIAEQYRVINQAMLAAIDAQWKDETLQEERDMYGEKWTIGATLWGLICHQIHHRGQMTVLMRQAGLQVPGIYGPAREEWGQFGMEAPTV